MAFNKNLFSKKHSYLTLLTAAGGTTVIAACSFTLSGSGRENTEQVQVKIPEAEATSNSSISSLVEQIVPSVLASSALIKEQAADRVDNFQHSCMKDVSATWYNGEHCKAYRQTQASKANR